MRKTLIFITVSLLTSALSFAQNDSLLTNKKGVALLPQKKDFALGIEANPFLNYLGNIFNNTSDNELDLGSLSLYGKYYLSDKTALRVTISVADTLHKDKYYVRDDAAIAADPLSNSKVIDIEEKKSHAVSIGVAYQIYRGYGRLQGFYGPMVSYSAARKQYNYTYGNEITELNPTPTSQFSTGDERITYSDEGLEQTISLGGITGVEYFFAPKMSVGCEFELFISYTWGSQGNSEYERWNGSEVETSKTVNSPGDESYILGTYKPSTYAGLFLMFHF